MFSLTFPYRVARTSNLILSGGFGELGEHWRRTGWRLIRHFGLVLVVISTQPDEPKAYSVYSSQLDGVIGIFGRFTERIFSIDIRVVRRRFGQCVFCGGG